MSGNLSHQTRCRSIAELVYGKIYKKIICIMQVFP